MDKFTVFMENEFNKLETEYKLISMEHSIHMGDYTTSLVLSEYDTMDYYREAEEKINEKTKNVFDKLINWFKKFFKKIYDKIMEILGKKPKQYKMWEKAPQVEKGLKGFVQRVKSIASARKLKEGIVSTLKAMGFVVLIANIPVIAGMVFQVVGNITAEGIIKGTKTSLEELNKFINSMELSDTVDYKMGTGQYNTNEQFSLLKLLKTIVSNILKFIVTAFNPVQNIVGNVGYGIGAGVDRLYGDGRMFK